jgi:alkanesulfonate monooxygenase SsuD/methylene tetrahydromethanopterin reductase-like flavin-dependent oxidoreductase (luciferase family)
MTRALKMGFILPQIDGKRQGSAPRWSEISAQASLAEDVGFDSLWLVDHLLYGFGPDDPPRGIWECWSLLAALAATTSKAELGTLVTCTGFRNPALLAKMADTVDEISDGRLILGLGAGYYEREYSAFGFPYDHRVGRFEEALIIISTLLREGKIDFDGRFYQARDCELRPRGPRPDGPPIMIGSRGERMMRLMANHAHSWNGWLVRGGSKPEDIPELREAVDAACVEVGRDPATIERTVTLWVEPGTEMQRPENGPISGSPDEIVEQLLAFQREGITHIQVATRAPKQATIEAFAPVLEALDRAGGGA